MKRFWENFENVNFGHKNGQFTPFWAPWKFSLKIQSSRLKPLFNAWYQIQIQKNLMNTLREEFK